VLTQVAEERFPILIFGSHAHGLARPSSERDFLIIEPHTENRFEETLRLRKVIGNALGDTVQPVDLIVTDSAIQPEIRRAEYPHS